MLLTPGLEDGVPSFTVVDIISHTLKMGKKCSRYANKNTLRLVEEKN